MVEKLIPRVESLKIGPSTDAGADIPPLSEAVEAFKTALAEARAAEDHLRTVLTEGGWLI